MLATIADKYDMKIHLIEYFNSKALIVTSLEWVAAH